jgi:hypothetical protein
VNCHERVEDSSVIPHAQVKQFVRDDEILEARLFMRQIDSKRHDASRGTGTPLAGHVLNADNLGLNSQTRSPVRDPFPKYFSPIIKRPHLHHRSAKSPG